MSPMTWNDGISSQVAAAAQTGLHNAAEMALAEFVLPITPKVTGALRGSLQVAENDAGGDPSVKIASSLIYAAYQHELSGTNYSEPGTGGKFLERGVIAASDKIPEAIAGPIRKVLE